MQASQAGGRQARACARGARRRYSPCMPMSSSVSSESTSVAPRPPNLLFPVRLSGCSSSQPQAYFSYAAHESDIACRGAAAPSRSARPPAAPPAAPGHAPAVRRRGEGRRALEAVPPLDERADQRIRLCLRCRAAELGRLELLGLAGARAQAAAVGLEQGGAERCRGGTGVMRVEGSFGSDAEYGAWVRATSGPGTPHPALSPSPGPLRGVSHPLCQVGQRRGDARKVLQLLPPLRAELCAHRRAVNRPDQGGCVSCKGGHELGDSAGCGIPGPVSRPKQAPILLIPEPELPFTLYTGASEAALGAVLLQDQYYRRPAAVRLRVQEAKGVRAQLHDISRKRRTRWSARSPSGGTTARAQCPPP